jgi:hypothetical protein
MVKIITEMANIKSSVKTTFFITTKVFFISLLILPQSKGINHICLCPLIATLLKEGGENIT